MMHEKTTILHNRTDAFSTQAPPIFHLLRHSRPSAIGWLIIPVVIRETVQGMLRGWFSTHVSQEALERVAPAHTHCDSSPSVPIIRRILAVVATILHSAPRFVLSTLAFAVRQAVSVCAHIISLRTPATGRIPIIQQPTFRCDSITTSALAEPRRRPAIPCDSFAVQHGQSSKGLSCEVKSTAFA